jgi:hypothetical protein
MVLALVLRILFDQFLSGPVINEACQEWMLLTGLTDMHMYVSDTHYIWLMISRYHIAFLYLSLEPCSMAVPS